ncbi:NUDIX hydrolase [Roseobacteraceae bacterium NS-SX3]
MDSIEGIGAYAPANARDRETWARLRAFCASEPQAFGRNPETGHVTGSAFVLSPDLSSVLLTHHAKLDRWLQLGGHCDGIADVPFVALKEVYEESGLSRIRALAGQVFDVDIHKIPARAAEPAHLHYDVRYLFRAEAGGIAASSESRALAWVPIGALETVTDAAGVLVLREKLPMFLQKSA